MLTSKANTTLSIMLIRFSFLVLIIGIAFSAMAQNPICEGNLGENIFEDGDFGSGGPNVIPTDPGIAPGYTYTTNVPPPDGYYTITNTTSSWTNLYGSWLKIGDNSSDPYGYMMVVNASYTPGDFYEQIIDGLCENTLYVFSADMINMIRTGVGGHIAPNVSFLIDDIERYTTGNVPQTNAWITYGFTFSTDPGQTSVKLTLRNNAPGGIGNDIGLDNITFRPCGPEALILPQTIENICEDGDPITLKATINGDQYPTPAIQWQRSFNGGTTWVNIPGANGPTFVHDQLSSGYYYYRYLLANSPSNLSNSKCRVNSNIKVVFVVPKFYTYQDTLCEGHSLIVGDNEYTESGTYVDSLISSIGCDSIVTLELTTLPDQGIEAIIDVQAPSCSGYSDGTIEIVSVANAYGSYRIDLNGLPPVYDTLFAELASGSYTLQIVDQYGCSLSETIDISDPVPFTIELGEDQFLELGESLRLTTSANEPIASFTWTPDVAAFCEEDCLILEWTPVTSDIYVLNAISETGCMASDSIRVIVDPLRNVFIPNVFSPNDDGFNDTFTIYGASPKVQSIESLQIFNRWGDLVFENGPFMPGDAAAGWDGDFGDKTMGADVFLYVAKIRYLDGVVETRTGDVLLLR